MMDSKTPGENGALEHSDAGSPLVALFFKLVRSLPDDSLASLTAAVPAEPAELADLTVLAFQTRATRGMGKGEKDLKYKLLAALPVDRCQSRGLASPSTSSGGTRSRPSSTSS